MTERAKPGYPIQRRGRRKRGPTPHLEDPVFRKGILELAAPGLSMRGVAALAGIPLKTLQGWINRGCAHPDEEPWGSFAVEYLAAERGLELSCAIPIAHWVNTMCTIAQQEQKTGVKGKTALSRGDVLLLDELRRNRFPKDHGASAHRVPEADPDPDGYLQQRALTQEQLTAMFAAPPEEIQAAMEAAGYVKVEKE